MVLDATGLVKPHNDHGPQEEMAMFLSQAEHGHQERDGEGGN